MSKKKLPRAKVQRCVGCDGKLPSGRLRLCLACEKAAIAKSAVKQEPVTGEVAGLVHLCWTEGIPVADILAEAIATKREEHRVAEEDARVRESAAQGATFLRKTEARKQFQRWGGAVYNGYVEMGVPWKEAARRVINDWRTSDGAVFKSIDAVKQAAYRRRKPKSR